MTERPITFTPTDLRTQISYTFDDRNPRLVLVEVAGRLDLPSGRHFDITTILTRDEQDELGRLMNRVGQRLVGELGNGG